VSNKAPLPNVDYDKWLQVFRSNANATYEHILIIDNIPESSVSNSASVIVYECGRAIASISTSEHGQPSPDWATRLSVGGVNINFSIVKQLPVLPPEVYLERARLKLPTSVELIFPRALELTYTVYELGGFTRDVG